jgi:hypothetical protein
MPPDPSSLGSPQRPHDHQRQTEHHDGKGRPSNHDRQERRKPRVTTLLSSVGKRGEESKTSTRAGVARPLLILDAAERRLIRSLRQRSLFSGASCLGSTQRECEGLDALIEELDLETTVDDWASLPDQLVHPLFDDHAGSLGVDVGPAVGTRRTSIDEHLKANGFVASQRAHHQMNVTSMDLKRDSAGRLVQDGCLELDGPITR